MESAQYEKNPERTPSGTFGIFHYGKNEENEDGYREWHSENERHIQPDEMRSVNRSVATDEFHHLSTPVRRKEPFDTAGTIAQEKGFRIGYDMFQGVAGNGHTGLHGKEFIRMETD